MSVIDMHGHLGTWPDFMIPEPGADWLIRTMRSIGIDAVAVSHLTAVGRDAVTGNRLALEASEAHSDHIGVLLVADPHDPRAPASLRELLEHRSVWGIKLHPDVARCPADDPRYEPFLQLAAHAGVPVLVHGQTGTENSDPARITTLAQRFPDVDVLMGHAGLWPHGFLRAARFAAETPRLHLEICGSRLTTRWLERMVAVAGAEKVVFGTDACFLDPRVGMGKVRYADLTEADRALVLGGNALRLLGERAPGGTRS